MFNVVGILKWVILSANWSATDSSQPFYVQILYSYTEELVGSLHTLHTFRTDCPLDTELGGLTGHLVANCYFC